MPPGPKNFFFQNVGNKLLGNVKKFGYPVITLLKADNYIIIESFRRLDPNTYTEIYNDIFLKKYTTALFKKQWGQNLIKFEGMQLPGGATLNGRQIYDCLLYTSDAADE